MDLRHYLNVLRRNAFVFVLAILVATTLAAFQHSRQTPVYEAEAFLLLRPENLPDGSVAERFDPARYSSVELAVITSAGVADAATALVPGYTGGEILAATSASADEEGATITVTAEARQPEVAAQLANAVSQTYVDQQQQAVQGGLQRVIDTYELRLTALSERLTASEAVDPTSPDLIAVREQYSNIFGLQQDLQVQLDLQQPSAVVNGLAVPPEEPSGLGLPAKLVLAALLGAAVGFGLAIAREELDDGVRSREEVLELTGMPVLVELPQDRRSSRAGQHLATADDSLGRFAEGIRSLRTSISFLGIDREGGIRQLLVTSTAAGDGKTLVAANLGVAYAQAGLRTVLVSADLRRPRLETLFGAKVGRPGLVDALGTGLLSPMSRNGSAHTDGVHGDSHLATRQQVGATLDEVILETRVPNLWLLPAGAAVPNPSELLSSSRMDDVIAALSGAFDVVIVDASPLLAVTDAAALASKIGHVLLVAGMPETSRRDLARAAEIVLSTRADVLGLVLNKVTARSASFGGDYGSRSEAPVVAEELATRRR